MEKLTFKQACRRVLLSKSRGANLLFAQSYARAGLNMTDPEAIRVQALYILANITYWRDTDAKAVRAALKEVANA